MDAHESGPGWSATRRQARSLARPGVRRRSSAALATGLLIALVGSGCQLLNPDPGSEVLEDFLTAVDNGDATAAAQLTTDPEAAEAALAGTFDSFEPADEDAANILDISRADGDRTDEGPVELSVRWLPEDELSATATGEATVVEQGDEHRVEWSNTLLDIRLTDGGYVGYQQITGDDIDVVDRTGQPLWVWEEVTAITLEAGVGGDTAEPGEAGADDRAESLVSALSGPVPTLTADSIREGLEEAGGAYQVVTLRPEDLEPVRSQLEAIEGVTLTPTQQLIRSDRELTSPALTELPDVVSEELTANAGWSIGVFNPGEGETRLTGEDPAPGSDLVSTLQLDIQQAALEAVDSSPYAASLVAIQPSTGDVLAIAQNDAADEQGPVATRGLFPPGSTFKVVTTAAALDEGALGADEIVPCPAEISVSGRTIPNFEDIGRGDIPMPTAFAESCNTTQAVIAERLGDDSIRDTAQQLGVAVDHEIPGLTITPDTVPTLPPGPARVESAIGQGEILSNPFGMAVMMASLGNNGTRILPSVIVDRPAQTDLETDPLAPETVSTMRSYLEQAVQSGTADAAAGIPGLGGKTGTAEVGDGDAHGWFAGVVGDLAFAVLLEHADSSTAAVQLSSQFLSGVPEAVPAIRAPAAQSAAEQEDSPDGQGE